jgi:hypothetical protein
MSFKKERHRFLFQSFSPYTWLDHCFAGPAVFIVSSLQSIQTPQINRATVPDTMQLQGHLLITQNLTK